MASSLFQTNARAAIPATASNAAGGLSLQIMQAAQSIKRIMGTLQAAKNPQAAIMRAAQQSPQLGAVIQMCRGRNPQDVFADECKKHGLADAAHMVKITHIFNKHLESLKAVNARAYNSIMEQLKEVAKS